MPAAVALLLSLFLHATPLAYSQTRTQAPGCAFGSIDKPAKLLSSLVPFKEAVRNAGFAGQVVMRLSVRTDGTAHDPRFVYPPDLTSAPNIRSIVSAWRFCPEVLHGRLVEKSVEFRIDVPAPR